MDAKQQALQRHGALNPHPDQVIDPLFQQHPFFDPHDLVLVKYEMLRRVRVEGLSVTQATAFFGFSRPVYYATLALFRSQGLPGLIPRRPGPHGGHKLSGQVVAFVYAQRAEDRSLTPAILVQRVQERFGVTLHPRSIERALLRQPKRGR